MKDSSLCNAASAKNVPEIAFLGITLTLMSQSLEIPAKLAVTSAYILVTSQHLFHRFQSWLRFLISWRPQSNVNHCSRAFLFLFVPGTIFWLIFRGLFRCYPLSCQVYIHISCTRIRDWNVYCGKAGSKWTRSTVCPFQSCSLLIQVDWFARSIASQFILEPAELHWMNRESNSDYFILDPLLCYTFGSCQQAFSPFFLLTISLLCFRRWRLLMRQVLKEGQPLGKRRNESSSPEVHTPSMGTSFIIAVFIIVGRAAPTLEFLPQHRGAITYDLVYGLT